MLGDKNATATIAVKRLAPARDFYERTLGLEPAPQQEPGALLYRNGNSEILVYESQFAGTNKATALTWTVRDVDDTVRDLKAKGVAFEHYDLPETKREGDVHVANGLRVAWFKDPDGNIHSLVNR